MLVTFSATFYGKESCGEVIHLIPVDNEVYGFWDNLTVDTLEENSPRWVIRPVSAPER